MTSKFLILAAFAVSCVAAYPGYHDVDYYVRVKKKMCQKKNVKIN